jgi:methionyl aminopeptidase
MVIVKNAEQIEGIKKSCHLLAQVLLDLEPHIKAGVTPKQIDVMAEKMIRDAGGEPAFKGYRTIPGVNPFPSTICASVNDIVVHGLGNSDTPLVDGDIIGIDCGINLNGYYSDMAKTFAIGKIKPEIEKLMQVTKESLYKGIEAVKPGQPIRDISSAVQAHIKPHGFGIVRGFAGHGVGLQVHEDPWIPNYLDDALEDSLSLIMQPGHIYAIEPMVTTGSDEVDILDDGWSVQTIDGSISAHFEHTVLVTEDGYEILTLVE